MQDDYSHGVKILRYGGADGRRRVTSKFEIMQIIADKDSIPPKVFILPTELYRELKYQYLTDYYHDYGNNKGSHPNHINGIPIEVERMSALPDTIDSFTAHCFFLSNFYTVNIESHGVIFPSAEHLFQAWKCVNKDDAFSIRNAPTPSIAKKLGRRTALRPDWQLIKLSVMREVVFLKFTQNKGLADLLDATGDMTLIEGNTWGDRFWGKVDNVGMNHLGRILMEVRQDLRRMKNA